MVVINFPHNPTGCMPTRAEYAAIVDVVRDAGAILFSDEMYRFLEVVTPEEEVDRRPSAVQLYTRAVALGGLSKSHSCPGLRCVCWNACAKHAACF
jgi:aspartate/methionine/tyrosine aminotransferase